MKKLFCILFITGIIITFNQNVFSQEMTCGSPEGQLTSDLNLISCFDVAELIRDCEEGKNIYMRVNLHYFTNDNCNSVIQITGTEQDEVYKHADDFIKAANTAIEENQRQWTVAGSTAPCNPLRYILSGIHMHCISNAQGGYLTTDLYNQFGVNKTTELNYFIADFPNITGGGIGYGTYGSLDWISTGLLNHELGHSFSLSHSWSFDGLSDTPELVYNWDANCDGDIIDNVDSRSKQCWNILEDGTQDSNGNGTYDCVEVSPCTSHPCCSWDNINNNVMSYNAYQSAYTSQQITKLLTHISKDKCDFIETISNCAPPKAIIGQTPFTLHYDNPCNECIYFTGSSNDSKFKFDLFENISGGRICILGQGWQTKESDKFCYGVGNFGVTNKLRPNTLYTIKLVVENACGETDEIEYTFITGNACIPESPSEDVPGFPNPSDGSYRINYYSNVSETVTIKAFHTLTGEIKTITNNYQLNQGNNQIDLNVSNLSNGSNIIFLYGNFVYVTSQLIKI